MLIKSSFLEAADMARRKDAPHGGHGWFVTFADLMGLLVSFFVMLVAFSNQDAEKLRAVTGSMREAFGVQDVVTDSGITESDGSPLRPYIKRVQHIGPLDSSTTPTPRGAGSDSRTEQAFRLAAASLRQALGEMPELAEASKHIEIEQSKQGLNIELMDQDGQSMFAAGSDQPTGRIRAILEAIAAPLRAVPYRIAITGHAAKRRSSNGSSQEWELSAHRANSVRQILEENGYPTDNIYEVAGKADTDPLLPEDPSAGANRRVTITLRREAPPVPPDLQP
jgi:chemotaxis protein MotB